MRTRVFAKRIISFSTPKTIRNFSTENGAVSLAPIPVKPISRFTLLKAKFCNPTEQRKLGLTPENMYQQGSNFLQETNGWLTRRKGRKILNHMLECEPQNCVEIECIESGGDALRYSWSYKDEALQLYLKARDCCKIYGTFGGGYAGRYFDNLYRISLKVGQSQMYHGNFNAADKSFMKAAGLKPTKAIPWNWLGINSIAAAFDIKKQFETLKNEARERFEKANKLQNDEKIEENLKIIPFLDKQITYCRFHRNAGLFRVDPVQTISIVNPVIKALDEGKTTSETVDTSGWAFSGSDVSYVISSATIEKPVLDNYLDNYLALNEIRKAFNR